MSGQGGAHQGGITQFSLVFYRLELSIVKIREKRRKRPKKSKKEREERWGEEREQRRRQSARDRADLGPQRADAWTGHTRGGVQANRVLSGGEPTLAKAPHKHCSVLGRLVDAATVSPLPHLLMCVDRDQLKPTDPQLRIL